jgi:hypothetical protein
MMKPDYLLDYDVITLQQPYRLYLMARMTSGSARDDKKRRALNLSVVIDHSGSMAGEKIDYTRQAAQFLVQNLNTRDTLSVVLYNDKVETLLPPEAVHRKDAINQRIDSIKAAGTTNLSGGWLEGCKHVLSNHDKEKINRVILMSDGLANRGITETDKLVALARQKFGEGVSTTTMGLGRDFNEDLLMAMANGGGGAFYFIESPEVTPMIFQEELQGLLSLIGQNLVITLETHIPLTSVHQMNGYPTHNNGRAISFRLGDVFGDEVKVLLLEINLPSLTELGERVIGKLRFEYDELIEGGTKHQMWEDEIRVNVTTQEARPSPASADIRRTVLLLKAAQARMEAVRRADKGHYVEAVRTLNNVADEFAPFAREDVQLAEEREALLKQAADMERGAAAYDEYSRKSMSTQAFYSMTGRHESTQVLREREKLRNAAAQNPHAQTSAAPNQPPPNTGNFDAPLTGTQAPANMPNLAPNMGDLQGARTTYNPPPGPKADPADAAAAAPAEPPPPNAQAVPTNVIPPTDAAAIMSASSPYAAPMPDQRQTAEEQRVPQSYAEPIPPSNIPPGPTPLPLNALLVRRRPGVTPTAIRWSDQDYPLSGMLVRVGRAQHNEIVVLRAGVSRFHCQLKFENNQWVLEDLGSTNGTLFNGRSVLKDKFVLSVGDEIVLCGEKLVLHD